MKIKRFRIIAVSLALMLALSVAGAQPTLLQTQALSLTAEAHAVGGVSCATVWGFTIALGAATLSGCGIICATGAWYSLALLSQC
jgi:hypothetical protein